MLEFLKNDFLKNEMFIYQRVGIEAKNIRENCLKYSENKMKNKLSTNILHTIKKILKLNFRYILLKKEEQNLLKEAKFRHSGEIHQWMYDKYSISKILKENNFTNIIMQEAFTSLIPNWNNYQILDVNNNKVRKPDSLFMEAIKWK